MRFLKGLKAAALALGVMGISAAHTAQADPLIVATDTAFVPFEFKQDGEYVGFDIDMWDAIAERMGVDYELRPMDFNGIIPALQTGNVDVAIAGMTIKSKREEVIDFSYPYYDSGLLMMVRSDDDSVHGPADLADKVIAVKQGTASADFADTLGAKEVRKFPNIDNAYLELRTGRVDVAMHDTPNVLYYIKTAGNGDVKAAGSRMDAQSYGIGFPQGSEWRDKVNVALLSIIEDGTYADIYRKWFGSDPK